MEGVLCFWKLPSLFIPCFVPVHVPPLNLSKENRKRLKPPTEFVLYVSMYAKMFTSMGLEAAEEIEIDRYFASKIENQFSIDRIMQLGVIN